MPKVNISLYATLRHYTPPGEHSKKSFPLEVPPATAVADIFEVLGIPPEEVKMIFVNNRHQDRNYEVQEGDKIGIFPPIAGG